MPLTRTPVSPRRVSTQRVPSTSRTATNRTPAPTASSAGHDQRRTSSIGSEGTVGADADHGHRRLRRPPRRRAGRVVEAVRAEPLPLVPAAPAPRLHAGRRLRRRARGLDYLRGDGVGIDHNPEAVRRCRQRGFTAFTPDEFASSPFAAPGRFDALLSAHVIEHLDTDAAAGIAATRYVPYVRPGGRVLLITPQERGFASDATHVTFTDDDRPGRACAPTPACWCDRAARSPYPDGRGGGSSTTSSSWKRRCRQALAPEGPPHPPRLPQRRQAVAHGAETAAVDVMPARSAPR